VRALVVRGISHEGRHYLHVEAAAEGLMCVCMLTTKS
jgi:hypothetical protein